jgi:hypothetical protein
MEIQANILGIRSMQDDKSKRMNYGENSGF